MPHSSFLLLYIVPQKSTSLFGFICHFYIVKIFLRFSPENL